jgi:hypothetical protein
MTELENLKIKLFEIVECIGALETKPNGDALVFTKEQLLSYSKFLINETVSNIQTGLKQGIDEDLLDEAVELELNYNREITVTIDVRAIQRQVISMVEDSIGEGGVEYCIQDALEHVFPTTQD